MVYADILQIPYSAWPIELQEEFKNSGKKLDLSPNERTKDSWGYIVSKGSTYDLYTYHSVTKDDFDIIQKVVFNVEEKMSE